MVLRKKPRDNIFKQRPIKILSAVLRMKVKILGTNFQALLTPRVYGGRQFAGCRGASAIGMMRFVQLILWGASRERQQVIPMLLDIAAAFDEVLQQGAIDVAGHLGRDIQDVVREFMEAYNLIRANVLTPYGLSPWY